MILAIDLDAADPGYYVEPTATSEAIDYKDPCKAGEMFFLFAHCCLWCALSAEAAAAQIRCSSRKPTVETRLER